MPLTCPLTGDPRVEVLEEIPSGLLIDGYRRDLGLEVAGEFDGVETVRLCHCPGSDLTFFTPPVTGSAAFYDALQRFDWYSPADKFEYRRAARWIVPGQRVLDVGCGAGHFARRIPHARYAGLEPNPRALAAAQHAGLSVHRETLADHAATHGGAYDAVCAFQVLEHLAEPRAFVADALACLKPGGHLILGVPNARSYVTGITNFVLNAPPHHGTWWRDQALLYLAALFELEVRELAHAPVERWESRLYWMQRLAGMMRPKPPRFSPAPGRRLLTVAGYLAAGLVDKIRRPRADARGATVVLIARKTS